MVASLLIYKDNSCYHNDLGFVFWSHEVPECEDKNIKGVI